MKETLIALCAILAVCTARVVITADDPGNPRLLGSKQCTWGPSYWCTSIETAAGCNATKHCIKKMWETMRVPEDNDSVCTICKDMVQQARDQLESNQTQNDLKAVFEGSCMLIHIKPIVKECINLVDEFIPDLVETLASQMNPSVVCSVAGLCNSAHIDSLLSQYQETQNKIHGINSHALKNDELEPDECSKCYTVGAHMQYKFNTVSRDQVLEQMLTACGEFGSLSDACASIVLTHFESVYSLLKDNLNADNICHLSGQCAAQYHKHEGHKEMIPKVEIRPLSSVGMVEVGDDLPCKLCEQLVGHLRDLLVANTTEAEFQQVLDGLCKQTKSFSTECTAIVDQYYPQIYSYLTKGLDSNLVCQMSGICPMPGDKVQHFPIWPLIPQQQSEIGIRIVEGSKIKPKNKEADESLQASEIEAMQLPVERMIPFGVAGAEGQKFCALCEYVLHYIQITITTPTNEEEVKQILGKVCKKIPGVTNECKEFVDNYGDAIVAILVQEIDPSQVCPMVHLCPSQEVMDVFKSIPKKYMLQEDLEKKPSCPLCLLAVTQIYNEIKDNRTEANIEHELDKLCSHLPSSLVDQCTDLVKGYSKELIEMLLADLTPQEVCVYIKLCDATKNVGPETEFLTDKSGEIINNEIPKYPLYSTEPKVQFNGACIICEYIMNFVDRAIGSNASKSRIENTIHSVCNHLPKTIAKDCNEFVDAYADVLIEILSHEVTPNEACAFIGFCQQSSRLIDESVTECTLCQGVLSTIDGLLGDSKANEEIEKTVAEVCKQIPASKQHKCDKLIEVYGQSIINLLREHVKSTKVCNEIALCSANDYFAMTLKSRRRERSINGLKKCTWGMEFVCSNPDIAQICNVTQYCTESLSKSDDGTKKDKTTQIELQLTT